MDNLPNISSAPEATTAATSSVLPPQKVSPRRRLYVLLASILVIGVAGILWYVLIGQQPDKLAIISLSNQEEIYIGQSTRDVASALGHVNPSEDVSLLEYPVPIDLTHPLQATVYLHEARVVAVRINRDKGNVDKQTGIHVGMTLDEVKTKTNSQVQPIEQPVKYGMATGLVKEDSKIKSYYLVNACIPRDDKVRVIIIVEKGFEERALELGAGCNGRGN